MGQRRIDGVTASQVGLPPLHGIVFVAVPLPARTTENEGIVRTRLVAMAKLNLVTAPGSRVNIWGFEQTKCEW